jgi:glycine C-acetyltransferase/8-amino-7-oxononanoate synthase
VAGALEALAVLEEQPRRIERLRGNAGALRGALVEQGFRIDGGETQIVPLVIGDPHLTMQLCERALARGVFAQAIRPPTVPRGSSRLRLAAMATHAPSELRWAARELATAAREVGLEPAGARPEIYLGEGVDEPPLEHAA